LTTVDALVEPYGVAVGEVNDPTLADVTLNMDTTSAVGGYADGVLGCTTDGGQITVITGWNFYAGSDPTQVGPGQYDLETVVIHELGHAMGLGHSADPTSVMYATLNPGVANRVMTTADLNVSDSDAGGACGLHAAGSRPGVLDTLNHSARVVGTVQVGGDSGLMALDDPAVRPRAITRWITSRAGKPKQHQAEGAAMSGPRTVDRTVAMSDGSRRTVLHARLVDSALDGLDR
jgi:hypothetical protein